MPNLFRILYCFVYTCQFYFLSAYNLSPYALPFFTSIFFVHLEILYPFYRNLIQTRTACTWWSLEGDLTFIFFFFYNDKLCYASSKSKREESINWSPILALTIYLLVFLNMFASLLFYSTYRINNMNTRSLILIFFFLLVSCSSIEFDTGFSSCLSYSDDKLMRMICSDL